MNAESRMSMKKFIEHLLKINLNLLSPDGTLSFNKNATIYCIF